MLRDEEFVRLYFAIGLGWMDAKFNVRNFPLGDEDIPLDVVEERRFDREMVCSEAEEVIRGEGLKPIGLRTAMRWIALHPDAPLSTPIVVLGAKREFHARLVCSPCFSQGERGRHANLVTIANSRFSEGFMVLVAPAVA